MFTVDLIAHNDGHTHTPSGVHVHTNDGYTIYAFVTKCPVYSSCLSAL